MKEREKVARKKSTELPSDSVLIEAAELRPRQECGRWGDSVQMNTAPHLHDEANSRLFQAFRSIRVLFQERFPGAFVLQEDALHQEWCVLAHVPWKDFFRFVYGAPLPHVACERLVDVAPVMMEKIRAVAEGRAARPTWALEQRQPHGTF